MTHFTVRVEVTGATSKDQELLDAALEAKGFYKRIYVPMEILLLPPGEYNYSSHELQEPTVQSVCELACAAVREATKSNMILVNVEPQVVVTQSADRYVSGLKRP
jgi:hypothetical protein